MNRRLRSAIKPVLALASLGAMLPDLAAGQVLEEIVVTAERRATALQDTPISIIALSSEALERKGIADLADVALFTPNLEIQGSRGSGSNQPTFAIRGISGGGGVASERGVALYIDGIYVPRTNGSVFKVFDIERIEVLRGPQGTLFGRNSTGGAIRLVTKQPTKNFEAYVRATGGNFDHREISGMVNLPVTDQFSLRAQAAYLNEEGYVRRGPQMLGSSEDKLGRLQAAIEATDNVKITLGALYSDSKSDGSPNDFETFDMAPGLVEGNFADWLSDALALAGQPRLATVDDPRIVLDDYTLPSFCLIDNFNPDWNDACKLSDNNKYYQADARVEWKINDAMTFTSTTGYAKMDHVGLMDWPLLGMERRPDDVQSKVLYQEFQLNAALFGGKVDLVTGINYFGEDATSDVVTLNRRGTSTFSPAGGAANGNGDLGLFTSANTATDQKSDSYGWFNSATWHTTDKLNVTVGARLARDKKDYEQTRYPSNGDNWNPAPGTTSTTVTTDHTWNAVDWRGTVDYHFTKELMAYATVSKAYRAGQYSYNILTLVPGPSQSGDYIKPIPPEKVISYELGARTTFLDGRLRMNPTLFMMKWSNRQAARQVSCVALGPAACPIGFTINIVNSGDVDIEGFEFDTQFAITDRLSIDGGAGVTNYDLKDPVANSGPNLFPSQASPTYNMGMTYQQPLTGVGHLGFNLNYSYVGAQETHPSANTDSSYELPSYYLMNARAQWTSENKHSVVSLFVNNLLDDTYANYATRFGGGFWDSGSGAGVASWPRSARQVVRGRPREYGITLQYNF